MKDANGSRFELLLGQADWGSCTHEDDDGVERRLTEGWATAAGRDRLPLAFDADTGSLSLSRRILPFRAAAKDTPPDPSRPLGAAADAFGSVYWVAEAGARIDVLSSGSRTVSLFAPADPPAATSPHAKGDFAPAAAAAAVPARLLRGLAVTTEHYLVAGVSPRLPADGSQQPGGLRVFDLVAGGPGLELAWPAAWPFAPHDLAARPCGGLAVLDRTHARVWMLDRRLGTQASFPVEANDALRAEDFEPTQPAGASAAPAVAAARPWFELVVDAAGGRDPAAVEVLADDAVLVMDATGTDGFALLSLYVDGVLAARASTRGVLDLIDARDRRDFVLRGYDCALAPRAVDQPQRLVIASHEGNQCYAFDLLRGSPALTADPIDSCLPMRRFGGKGLVRRAQDVADIEVAQDTGLMYDGAGTWLPLVSQARPRFAARAMLTTPVLDSEVADCTWHRLVIDGCIPAGCTLAIESRAADASAALENQRFLAEPHPMLRANGAELPWLLDGPGAHTDAASGRGSWELLFQRARGRYLQLRLVLAGDELASPRLVALRAWSPRFSYAREYLPAVYREDESSADFLERFLANFEGSFTALEDRIAAAAALFDVRTAPDETLDWLASWLGLVFDRAVDAKRKRLLIRFALPLYAYRGTTQGLRLATQLVLSPCVRPEDLGLPAGSQDQPRGIRIVERYLTRRLPRALLGETVIDAPRWVAPGARWSPAEGAQGLQLRYAEALKRAGVVDAGSPLFAPVPPTEPPGLLQAWSAFCLAEIGSVPQLASALVTSWKAFLSSLSNKHGMGPTLPIVWPIADAQQRVWQDFLTGGLGPDLRRWLGRWQVFLARRYLRADDAGFIGAWGRWPSFDLVPAPDALPTNARALSDWALFETRLEAMAQTAHRFSVLLPTAGPSSDAAALDRQVEFAQRVVRLEKPAHTAFDVRSYWAMFRVGQVRVGLDSLLGIGSRAPELAPQLVIGNGRVGASRVAFERHVPGDRLLLAC
ncbi:phage tail protein [Variovorax sp. J22P240]|uniref:phage tail protein n=1 Tax=Variovorax sp. J22P240 TaxID=3053514 RepID=UPI00257681D5|nr:phage tail protein [Variovorax sp. J22P240]MDM0001808.1 phage tail protein [Variovorax sp. J22P240]